jgi:hypothetical protein
MVKRIRFLQGAVLCLLTPLVFSSGWALAWHVIPEKPKAPQAPTDSDLRAPEAPLLASPRITSPVDNTNYTFGNPISFTAVDDNHICGDTAYEMDWWFEKNGVPIFGLYSFLPGRVLDYAGGTHLMPLPATYRVRVSMCGVTSPTIKFTVSYGTKVLGQVHPDYEEHGIVPPCIDYDNAAAANHRTSAHFNIYWNTTGMECGADPQPVVTTPPTDEEIGLLECTYFTLARWMTSPLSHLSIYRDHPDYDHLTHIPIYKGQAGGGGGSLPQGLFFGVQALNHYFAHELFHVFDYAGNPLHKKFAFDWRYQNNPYHFYHEGSTKIEQTMGKEATTFWGYRSDTWPVWDPVDLGFLELDYDSGPFYAYLMDTYGDDFAVGGRETWEGPSFDACQTQVEYNPAHVAYRPHNFKFFEAWNSQVRSEVQAVDDTIRLDQYPEEYCDLAASRPDKSFLYVGQVNPPCLQTLEYEMDVIEDLIKARVAEAGTPLEESMLLDFAVAHAKAFPPNSLLADAPQPVSCLADGRLNFAKGFNVANPACGFPAPIADARVCAALQAVNEHDFYARIQFRILEPDAHYLQLRANDDATLYMNGEAVLGQAVVDNPSTVDYPNASTTYADQSEEWPNNNAPVSSIFPVGNPLGKTFEIEWVNRGDTRGNNDDSGCSADHSRYLLMLEWSNQAISNTFQILGDDKVQLINANFWPNQGSGLPGFRLSGGGIKIPEYDSYTSRLPHEIQMRPVAWLERTFLLPALGVNYHPVQCPFGYTGDLEVVVVDDDLDAIYSRPSVHLLTLQGADDVEWLGELDVVNALTHRIMLTCDGHAGPAEFDGDPAVILVTGLRTVTNPLQNPHGQMGAVQYTVIVKIVDPFKVFIPLVRR